MKLEGLDFDDLFPKTPLHDAAGKGDIEAVKTLLAEGRDVNEQDRISGNTPLHEAISRIHVTFDEIKEKVRAERKENPQNNEDPLALLSKLDMRGMARQRAAKPEPFFPPRPDNLDMVQFLLRAGADVNAVNNSGYTPLYYAAEGGQMETVRLLLDWGAETHRQDNEGKNALMTAAEHQRFDVVRVLLERGTDPEQRTAQGYTSLMAAARGGSVEIAKLFLEHGVGINVVTESGNTALLTAIISYRDEMRDFLIERGAEVGVFEAAAMGDIERARTLPLPEIRTPHWGYTLLSWAIRIGNDDIVQFVLSLGLRFFANDPQTQRLSRMVTMFASPEILRLLVDSGMPLESSTHSVGSTQIHHSPLASAVLMNNVALARILLEQGADVEDKENPEEHHPSPLTTAVTKGSIEMAILLLDHGANPNGSTRDTMPPLMMAMHKDDEAMVNLLLERGANPKAKIGDAFALMAAHNSRFLPKLKESVAGDFFELAKAGKTAELAALLAAGTNPNSTEDLGRTALHLAARAGHLDTVQTLLDHGAEVNASGLGGLTPLMDAVFEGDNFEIIALLIERGADIAAESDRGNTALRTALANKRTKSIRVLTDAGEKIGMTEAGYLGDRETLRYFLREGKDVDGSNNGVTALMAAAHNGHRECVLFLLEKGANINAIDNGGETALFHAVTNKDAEMVNLLLDHGAEIDACGTDHWAQEFHEKWIASKEHNAETNQFLRENAANKRGMTPLECAAFFPESDIARLLLNRGANVNGAQTAMDMSPLSMAVLGKRTETVKLLLERGADVHRKDQHGFTIIENAKRQDAPAEIIALLEEAAGKKK